MPASLRRSQRLAALAVIAGLAALGLGNGCALSEDRDGPSPGARVGDGETPPGTGGTPGATDNADTTGWSTYGSPELGLSFDYPPHLTLVEDHGTGDGEPRLQLRLLGDEAADPISRERSPGVLALELLANPEGLDPTAWLEASGWPPGTGPEAARTVELAGRPAIDVATGRMLAPNRFLYVALEAGMLRVTPIGAEAESILASLRRLD